MKVFVYDPFISKDVIENLGGIKVDSMEDACKTMDAVSLHIPLNDKTKNIINYDLLKTMKNNCVIINDTPENKGMLIKVKDYVTWGTLDDTTFKDLVEKRGHEYRGRTTDSKQKYSYKTFDVDGKKYKPYFRLNPPQKGFGRKGIKVAFKVGGALGDRKEKINDLIKRML